MSQTHPLGAKHETTLLTASNLAFSLLQCGQKTEAGKLLCDTEALCRLALGPTHWLTPSKLN